MQKAAWLAVLVLAACGGDDDGAGAAQARGPAPRRTGGRSQRPKRPKLTPRLHVEDRVACPTPEKSTRPRVQARRRDLRAGPLLPAHGRRRQGRLSLRAVPGAREHPPRVQGARLRRRAERAIRSSRSCSSQAGLGRAGETKPDLDKTCTRPDQLVATNYSYEDLKLVGIVAQGTQRKALMMDTGNARSHRQAQRLRRQGEGGRQGHRHGLHHVRRRARERRPRDAPGDREVGAAVSERPDADACRPREPPPVDQGPAAPVIAPPGSARPRRATL